MPKYKSNDNDYVIDIKNRQIRNINLVQFFSNYPVLYLDHLEGLTLMVGKSDKPWVYFDYEPVENSEDLSSFEDLMTQRYKTSMEILISNLPPEYCHFAALENWMTPLIIKERQICDVLKCKKLYIQDINIKNVETQLRDYSENSALEMTNLYVEDADCIQKNHKYADFTDVAYIEERIQNGLHAGIRKEGELVAWVMTHDDGAIGILYVVPAYRGIGLADWLTQAMLYRLHESKLMPFVHIEADNFASMSLAKKTGFLEAFEVTWFSLK